MEQEKCLLAELFHLPGKDNISPSLPDEVSCVGNGIEAGTKAGGYGCIETLDIETDRDLACRSVDDRVREVGWIDKPRSFNETRAVELGNAVEASKGRNKRYTDRAGVDVSDFEPAVVQGELGCGTGKTRAPVEFPKPFFPEVFHRVETGSITYDVETVQPFTEQVVGKDTFFVPLSKKNLVDSSFTLKDAGQSTVNPASYYLDAVLGRFRGTSPGSITSGATYTATYRYHPVSGSTRLNSEDDNPVFDGVKIIVQNDITGIDSLNSGWRPPVAQNILPGRVQKPQALTSITFYPAPLDIEVRWNRTDTTANGKWLYPGDTLINNNNRKVVVCPFKIVNVSDTSTIRAAVDNALRDSVWKPGREVVIITPPNYGRPNSRA